MRGFGIFLTRRPTVRLRHDPARCPTFPWLFTAENCEYPERRRFADPGAAVQKVRRVARVLRAEMGSPNAVLTEIDDAVWTP